MRGVEEERVLEGAGLERGEEELGGLVHGALQPRVVLVERLGAEGFGFLGWVIFLSTYIKQIQGGGPYIHLFIHLKATPRGPAGGTHRLVM